MKKRSLTNNQTRKDLKTSKTLLPDAYCKGGGKPLEQVRRNFLQQSRLMNTRSNSSSVTRGCGTPLVAASCNPEDIPVTLETELSCPREDTQVFAERIVVHPVQSL